MDKLWVVTKIIRLQIPVIEMSFFQRVVVLSLRDKGERLRVEPLLLCIER